MTLQIKVKKLGNSLFRRTAQKFDEQVRRFLLWRKRLQRDSK